MVPVDPNQQDKATTLKLYSFKRPHMRAFHFAWFGFFMAFVSWFAFAPLMNEIKEDLGMSKDEVYNANISSVASTVLSRFIVGPLCDTFGARLSSSTLLIMGSIPTAFSGLVQSAVDVAIIRFFIGVMGATFVCTQFWSSQIFVKEFVGTANATTGGWGNLGGGVTQIFMVAIWNGFKTVTDNETAWRVSFLVPAVIVFLVAIGQVFLADDCPKGNYKELQAHGAMTRKSSAESAKLGYLNVNSWLLFLQYAACFGVELTVNNTAASYFSNEFGLSTTRAGMVAALFGLMNLFARSLGGGWSDFLYAKFGSGVTGMRGRFIAQWTALIWEAIFLYIFTLMTELERPSRSHPLLSGYNGGGYLVRYRPLRRPRRDGCRVGYCGRGWQLRRGDVGPDLPVRSSQRASRLPHHCCDRAGPIVCDTPHPHSRLRHGLHTAQGRTSLHRKA
ncbi:unnamed protein product, partial [Ascophyllum nodosum]